MFVEAAAGVVDLGQGFAVLEFAEENGGTIQEGPGLRVPFDVTHEVLRLAQEDSGQQVRVVVLFGVLAGELEDRDGPVGPLQERQRRGMGVVQPGEQARVGDGRRVGGAASQTLTASS